MPTLQTVGLLPTTADANARGDRGQSRREQGSTVQENSTYSCVHDEILNPALIALIAGVGCP